MHLIIKNLPILLTIFLLVHPAATKKTNKRTKKQSSWTPSALYKDECEKIYKDADLCNETISSGTNNCYCDDDCIIFNDCCKDAKVSNNIIKSRQKQSECKKLNETFYINTISNCNESWTEDETKNKCIFRLNETIDEYNLLTQIPVYSYIKNYTYKNIFCAKCNYEPLKVLRLYQLRIEFLRKDDSIVDSDKTKELSYNLENCFDKNGNISCDFYYAPDDTFIMRRCGIDYCPSKTSIDKMCFNNFTAHRWYDNKIYKNEHYLSCHIPAMPSHSPPLNNAGETTKTFTTKRKNILQININLPDCKTNRHLKDSNKLRKNNKTSYTLMETIFFHSYNGDCEDPENNVRLKPGSDIILYITIIGNSTSIISLIFLYVVHSITKSLKKPCVSKVLLSLATSLLLVHTFTLLSSFIPIEKLEKVELFKNITLCFVFGFFIHYSYLAYFTWSSVMSFNLFKALASTCYSKDSSVVKFIVQSLYAWLMPVVLIVILFVIRLSNDTQYEIYGNEAGNCFLSNNDRRLFFIIPVSSIWIFNLIIFVKTVFIIRQNSFKSFLKKNPIIKASSFKKQASRPLNKNSKQGTKLETKNNNLFVLSLKLFILMGCSWCIILVNYFFKYFDLEYSFIMHLFVFVNSFQGFLLFILMVFNPQTLKELRKNN